ncbi:MAG TPA: methyltransferase domain-containing protein [Candidatus Limnocylindrales bacterium]|nr:methyltransferase domain-containing protein [Candidatus Limnocylindrales bacterium]
MVDRSMNYGRPLIARFVRGLDVKVAVDLGPGQGDDMRIVSSAHPHARIVGIEAFGPTADGLRAAGFEVASADVERDRLPFEDSAVDLVVANQLFEHIKEIFWVLHECARVCGSEAASSSASRTWPRSTTACSLPLAGSRVN